MPTMFNARGFCSTAATTAAVVDGTTQLRYVRVVVYNPDSIQHLYDVAASSSGVAVGTKHKRLTLQANEDRTAGPYQLVTTDSLLVQQQEATSATTSTYMVIGEY